MYLYNISEHRGLTNYKSFICYLMKQKNALKETFFKLKNEYIHFRILK